MHSTLNFYEPDDPHGYLSNFAEYSLDIDGRRWPTAEHFYQAQKFVRTEVFELIAGADTPADAFALSRKYSKQVRADWDRVKDEVMTRAIENKFAQHPRLAFWLVATGDSEIKEHSHIDDYWGDGGDGSGQNKLGRILMRERELLATQSPHDRLRYVDSTKLPTDRGLFKLHGFLELANGHEHVALSYGHWRADDAPLVRLHSQCLTGDVFGSQRCDCGPQLNKALDAIVAAGSGLLLYLPQEGRGIGLLNKIRAYHLQDLGADTVDANLELGFGADMRDFTICYGMLRYFNISKLRLMTNNPSKLSAVGDIGVDVVERVPLEAQTNAFNNGYLHTKSQKMGHILRQIDEGTIDRAKSSP